MILMIHVRGPHSMCALKISSESGEEGKPIAGDTFQSIQERKSG